MIITCCANGGVEWSRVEERVCGEVEREGEGEREGERVKKQ